MAATTGPQDGRLVTIFRSRLRHPAPGYEPLAEDTLELARSMPGFVDFKSFEAPDGERVSIITFDSPEAQRAWREHPEHRKAQQRGGRVLRVVPHRGLPGARPPGVPSTGVTARRTSQG